MPAGVLAFVIALFASLMLTVPVRALALRVGMVDLPGPRKVHVQPIPLLGGLAMYGGVMLGDSVCLRRRGARAKRRHRYGSDAGRRGRFSG